MGNLSITIVLLYFFENTSGQGSQTSRLITVNKTASKIVVNGILDQDTWQAAAVTDSFINKWPADNEKAKPQTEVRVAYNDQYIYFGIKAYIADKAPVIQSLKRDINPYYSDGVSVVIDPSNKSTSGHTFGVNAPALKWKG